MHPYNTTTKFQQAFQKVISGLAIILATLAILSFTSCHRLLSKTYDIYASSDSITGEKKDLDIQEVFKNGKLIGPEKWKEALDSDDFVVISVASPKLRKMLSEGER